MGRTDVLGSVEWVDFSERSNSYSVGVSLVWEDLPVDNSHGFCLLVERWVGCWQEQTGSEFLVKGTAVRVQCLWVKCARFIWQSFRHESSPTLGLFFAVLAKGRPKVEPYNYSSSSCLAQEEWIEQFIFYSLFKYFIDFKKFFREKVFFSNFSFFGNVNRCMSKTGINWYFGLFFFN